MLGRLGLICLALTLLLGNLTKASADVKVGQPFPSFVLKQLGKSETFNLESTRGKVVIVDFWASWCEPCKKELPALNGLYKKLKAKGLIVVGVNVDDAESSALEFLKEHPAAFPLVFDSGKKVITKLGLTTMPTSFVLDRKGNIKFIHRAYHENDIEKFEKEVKSIR